MTDSDISNNGSLLIIICTSKDQREGWVSELTLPIGKSHPATGTALSVVDLSEAGREETGGIKVPTFLLPSLELLPVTN